MRPYVNTNLFKREFNLDNTPFFFVADPGTQRWLIGNREMEKVINACDGKTQIKDISLKTKIPYQQAEYIVRSLENEGLIFQDEAQFLQNCQPIVRDTDIMAFHLEITNKCNLRCGHCYLNSGNKKETELTKEELFNIIDQLEPGSGKKICITGGEPFLHPDFFELIEYTAVTRMLETDIYTNALLINEETAHRLKDINDRSPYGINIQISLEGANAEINDRVRGKGVFDKVGETINLLSKIGMNKNIVLFVCLTKENISQVADMINLAEILNIKALKFSQWQKQGRALDVSWADKSPTMEEWVNCGHILLEYPHQQTYLLGNFWGDLKNDSPLGFSLDGKLFPKFCCNFKVAPRIDCQGNVWPCQVYVDKDFIVGNIKTESIESIFRSGIYRRMFKDCEERENSVSECQSCQWKSFCGGGCSGFAYAEHQTLKKKDFFCEVRKYWFEQYIGRKINQLAGREQVLTNSTY